LHPVLPPRPVIGILHPGAMGAAVGNALKPVAGAVIWAAAGRSLTTSKRAETADLIGVPDVAELARRADVIISVCPPDAARAVAHEVAPLFDRPGRLFVDANAVSPATVTGIAELLGTERVVDGAIIGPPAWEPGRTVVWLAGAAAPAVAALFAGSPFAARVLPGPVGSASALKACFALQSKALPTLWVQLDAAAQAYGVADEIREELHRTGVDLDARLAGIDAQARGKAWRWVGEMQEAAEAFAAVGLPDGFSRAAAETYERMAAADPTDRANPWGLRGPAEG
jgi:3-hydroxyisobutyrate dehydrogenase-like beta-hydroxyacid dehydrogenase